MVGTQTKYIEFPKGGLEDLRRELDWFNEVLACRLKLYFGHESDHAHISEISRPDTMDADFYGRFVSENQLTYEERLVLLLALIPHIQPFLLDPFFVKNATYDRPFSEFGGIYKENPKGFFPTGETAMFLLTGTDIAERSGALHYFSDDHLFAQKNILTLKGNPDEPEMTAELKLNESWVHYFLSGEMPRYSSSPDFPAQLIQSEMEWEELVLPEETEEKLEEVIAWAQHGDTIMKDWGLGRRVKPGYSVLFHGPPGTGKTLTASLIGKETGMEVYRIDLSRVVSKYIGETEKNLAKVFQRAESKNWILFFDEADALFGKRTEVSSSHDRYANQEVSYLLQRLDEYDGLAILATNLKTNLDDAFARRFHSTINFPIPNASLRFNLWQSSFPEQVKLASDIDLEEVAEKHKLAGGSIINVVRYCSLQILAAGKKSVSRILLEKGIRQELDKEGRTLTEKS